MENIEVNELLVDSFACTGCGAELKYKPGTQNLHCEYCGTENEIPQIEDEIIEQDYYAVLESKSSSEPTTIESFVKCESCGASSTLEPNITSAFCPYCSTPLILDHVHEEEVVIPQSILPFKLDKQQAKSEFKKWIDGLWFAPGDLKKAVLSFDHFKGVYVPYRTFDADTVTQYVGQRGEYYYVNESYTTTENGQTVTKTRRVQKIRWYPASGTVSKFFDDILTVSTKSLPEKYIDNLEPWDLQNLTPFDKKYVSGFITEKHNTELSHGFERAKEKADEQIKILVQRDIGGDTQRILSLNSIYNDITFKHIHLPVYVSAFKFKDKLYQFLVNARTGEVQGERPYSWIKIVMAVILGLIIIGTIFFFLK
ncbi:hypothetical protein [Marinigracilibium pacificum]|uniref:Replication restart DNA helicase PriA n=1 Tax=Marinigracilibium pacificum TaxID=2729599 RepID=A0A848J073_9BACT|nr:hypothetical protein [Marinigracilibium pacificum]NMM47659.1 hypothetical protein [Marinigracilibium pacificum]